MLFYCQTPASQGGETVIADVRQIYDSLDKTVIDKLVRLGVQYFRYMPCRNDKTRSRYVSWQEVSERGSGIKLASDWLFGFKAASDWLKGKSNYPVFEMTR